MSEEVKMKNLYNNPKVLYKYFPISTEYAVKSQKGIYTFRPNVPRAEWEKDKENEILDKWRAIVFDGIIFYTSPKFFNDPFDTVLPSAPEMIPTVDDRKVVIEALQLLHKLKKEQVDRLLYSADFDRALELILTQMGINNEMKNTLLKEIKHDCKRYRDEIAITCFSEVNDSKLMWAHYANSYTGFCIEYDFAKSGDITFQKGMGKVIYTDKRPVEEDFENNVEYENRILCTKAECWSYEKEWRSINIMQYSWHNNNIYPMISAKKFITAVYLGCNMKEEYQDEIIEYYKGTDIKVYQMKLREDIFDFYFEECV